MSDYCQFNTSHEFYVHPVIVIAFLVLVVSILFIITIEHFAIKQFATMQTTLKPIFKHTFHMIWIISSISLIIFIISLSLCTSQNNNFTFKCLNTFGFFCNYTAV
eukprot:383832_1